MTRILGAALALCLLATGTLAADRSAYHGMVTVAAFSAGVPPSIAHAVIRHESNYNPGLRGRAGEWGIGQIKCQTARSVGFSGPCGGLADASTNLTYSMRYLALALARGGAGCSGVALYQMGIFGRPRCTAYGQRVIGLTR